MAAETAPLPSTPTTSGAGAAPAHCPICGAKRTRPDSSSCAYCATPFELVAPRETVAGHPNQARLARMKDQPGYAEAAAWTPLESLEHQALERRKRRGMRLLLAGGALAAGTLFLPAWVFALGAIAFVGGLGLVLPAQAGLARILRRPLLARPALVLDRRSETEIGTWSGRTTYFFALELAGGSEGEFRWPGRGLDHPPLVNGATGIAFTRGAVLLGFRAIRV
jgi:hypothetical protein